MKVLRTVLPVSTLLLFLAGPSTAQVTGLSGWSIYIDPGHSRTENMGIFGYSEAEKNLRVGLALREMLLQTTDIDTVYISRTNDQMTVSLSQRSDDANDLGAAWFHSIHSDAGSPTANKTLLLWGQLKNGNEKTPPGGHAMSDIMVDLLSRGMRIPTRGSIGDCGFYGCHSNGPYLSVNRNTTMPSELSEAGFHTNPTQNTRNMNRQWKRLEAKTLYWSILDFHGIPRPSERIVTGFVKNIETGEPLSGAVVTLGDSTHATDTFESLFNRYTSDPDQLHNGFFYFEDTPGGVLSMRVDADGFLPYQADVSPVDTFFTFHDVELLPAIPPQVAATSPLPDSTLSVIDHIIVDFSRIMDRSSVESAFSLEPITTGRFVWKQNDFQLIFIPDSLQGLTDYTLTISESALGVFGDGLDGDADGIPGGDFVLTFRTGFPDVLPPAIRASYPRAGSRNVARDPIVSFTYDEVIDDNSIVDGMVRLEPTAGGGSVSGTAKHYVVNGRSVLTFFPEEFLMAATSYRFSVAPGLRDRFGNEETFAKQFRFITGLATYEHTEIDSLDGNLDEWWIPQQSGSTIGIVTDSTARIEENDIVNRLTGSSGAMRIDYGWDTAASDWLIQIFLNEGAPRAVFFDSTYTLEAYVFGDGRGNRFRFAVDDNVPVAGATNHEVSPWFTVNWYGWQLVSWRPERDGVGVWVGDGTLNGALRFNSIQLTYTPGSNPFGTFIVDDLRVSKVVINTATEPGSALPERFVLHQNYPNPFNPSTTIRFELGTPGPVSLKIYNVLGAEVAVLADRIFPAGTHAVTWDAARMPSGMYFARMQAGPQSRTITLMLVK